MKIKKITTQIRRDIWSTLECEFCGNIEESVCGYDDNFYHECVLPNIKCNKCSKSTISENGTVEPYASKYPDGLQI